jgi:hypothetical protein
MNMKPSEQMVNQEASFSVALQIFYELQTTN